MLWVLSMNQLFCIEKNFLVLCFHKMNFPVFPLNGAILFPNTNLPLNIFEERYVDMVDYALSNNRLIGMIQSKENKSFFGAEIQMLYNTILKNGLDLNYLVL